MLKHNRNASTAVLCVVLARDSFMDVGALVTLVKCATATGVGTLPKVYARHTYIINSL